MRINNVTFTAFEVNTPFGEHYHVVFHKTGDMYIVGNTTLTTTFDGNIANNYYNISYGVGWRKHIKDVQAAIDEQVQITLIDLKCQHGYKLLNKQKELSAFAIQWLRTKTVELSIEQDKDKIAKWAETTHKHLAEKGYTLVGEDGAIIMALTTAGSVLYYAYVNENLEIVVSTLKGLNNFGSDTNKPATVRSWQGSINNILDRWGWKLKQLRGRPDVLRSKYDHVNYNGILYPIRVVKLPESSDYVTVATHDLGNVLMDKNLEYVDTLARTIGLGIYHYTDTVVFNGSAKELAHEAWVENGNGADYSDC